ncbi:MAG: glycosyltransferase family 2 protein, partial [Prevotellaceae bacterium]|nr:glycosyltransferase family 2 protein [Prevotellaceae bacterium]
MKDVKISIITISFNSENTIEETIRSVIDQDYDNVEYIIIDGKSTDNTLNIINKYREHIDVLVSEKDRGISDAFNKGISHATGDMICLINSDDYLLPGSLSKVAEEYDGKSDIYSGNVLLWNPDNGFRCREIPSVKFPIMPFFCHVAHQGMFATKECYRKYGTYDINIRFPMDLDFLIRAYNNGAKFHYMNIDVAG